MDTNEPRDAIDVLAHNRAAWDKEVEEGNCWTIPVSSEQVDRARHGDFTLVLTPTKTVPKDWFPELSGAKVLCLASGGGQQGPLLAAAGADVTVFDNSPRQLAQDEMVAARDNLVIKTVQGDMIDLSAFEDNCFDLIVHPASNCFAPDILPVWRECYRVLHVGGALISGFCNPVRFAIGDGRQDNGDLTIRYPIPHSDIRDRDPEDLQKNILDKLDLIEFGHTLQDQIGGQLAAGLLLAGFYEDRYVGEEDDPVSEFLDTFIATRAIKPAS